MWYLVKDISNLIWLHANFCGNNIQVNETDILQKKTKLITAVKINYFQSSCCSPSLYLYYK
jgi:hypothetical protein